MPTLLRSAVSVPVPGPGGIVRLADSEGAGDALVLLHGLGNSLNYWHAVYEALAEDRRVVALDIPGFGRSTTPAGGAYSLDSVAATITAVLDARGVTRPVVCGHSMGAIVALEVAERVRARGLVLVSGTLLSAVDCLQQPLSAIPRKPCVAVNLLTQGVGALLPSGEAVATAMTSSPLVRVALFGPFVRHPARVPAATLRYAIMNNGSATSASVLRLGRQVDLRKRLSGATMPTAVVSTQFDRLVPRGDVEEAVDLMAPAYRGTVDDCGHWPMLEEPGETAGHVGEACAVLTRR